MTLKKSRLSVGIKKIVFSLTFFFLCIQNGKEKNIITSLVACCSVLLLKSSY